MRQFKKIGCALVLTGATTVSAATIVSPPDQQGWLSPTVSNNVAGQIDLQWGDTELVVNGGFENDTWYNATRDTNYAYAGQYRLQVPQNTGTSQIVTTESNATFIASAHGQRVYPGLPRLLLTDYNGADSDSVYLSNQDVPNWDYGTLEITTGASNTSTRIWLYNLYSTSDNVFFDDVSLKPKNLYVYRSTSPFTNTASATLIGTLDGLTATGYSDVGASGDYWYAVSASNVDHDVTSYMGSAAVPEPASLGLVALVGGLALARRRA